MTDTHRPRLAAPALALALSLAACAEERGAARGLPAAGAGPSAVALPTTLVEGEWAPSDPAVVATLLPPPALGGAWRASKAEVVLSKAPAGLPEPRAEHLVYFPPDNGDQVLRIDGEFAGGSFDLVELRFGTLNECRIRALFETPDGELATPLAHEQGRKDGLVEVRLPLDAFGVERRTFPTFTVHVASTEAGLGLVSVRLLKRAETERFPSPLAEPRHVAIGTESRLAVGLLPGRTLAVALDGTRDARLSVGLGQPRIGAGLPPQRVRVTILRDGREVDRRTITATPGWRRTTLPLTALDGAPGEARVSLEDDAWYGVALEPPTLLREVAAPRTVLLVTSDTHRADHVGCAGGAVRTPTIDALAARGALFTDCIATTTITNPSHIALMTGLPLRDTGIYGNLTPLAERADTLAERFRAAGFRTLAAVSAEHLRADRSGLGQGFERLDGPGDAQRDSAETIAVLEPWLAELEGQDAFVWLHVFDAHTPYTPPVEDTRAYYGGGDPYDARLAELAPAARAYWDERVRDAMYILAQYKGEVTYLDRLLGDVLAHPRLRDGVVALTADHGEALGENGVFWEHRALYPASLDVPLVLAGPGIPAGRRIDAPVQNSDLARTLLELADLDATEFPGRSLLDEGALAERAREPRLAIGMMGTSASIQHGDWFLVLHLVGHAWGTPTPGKKHDVELFDLAQDPRCTLNLAPAEHERAARMRAALVQWLLAREGHGLADSKIEDAAAVARIQALGYATTGDAGAHEALFDPACACPRCRPFQ